MSTAPFMPPTARDAFLDGEMSWTTDDWRVVLSGPGYTPSEAHEFADEITDVQGDAPITGRSKPGNGVADADDTPVPGVPAADQVTHVIVCHGDGSSPATERIVWVTGVYTDGTPILRVSDGNDIVVVWSNAPRGIFQV